ncbi:helix-turn-helix domain-containing protein [Terriglobus roseus]
MWLLSLADQLGSQTFAMTQMALSSILGVQRSSLNLAAAALKTGGLIDYRRGRLWIQDREGLIGRACSCYSASQRLVRQLHKTEARELSNPAAWAERR